MTSPTYTKHLASAIAKMMTQGDYGTYHLSGRGKCSYYELAKKTYELLGMEVNLKAVDHTEFEDSFNRPLKCSLKTNKDILLPAWEEGLKEYLNEIR
jgi:dTDP-4-dehydrorhamnose reductase